MGAYSDEFRAIRVECNQCFGVLWANHFVMISDISHAPDNNQFRLTTDKWSDLAVRASNNKHANTFSDLSTNLCERMLSCDGCVDLQQLIHCVIHYNFCTLTKLIHFVVHSTSRQAWQLSDFGLWFWTRFCVFHINIGIAVNAMKLNAEIHRKFADFGNAFFRL